MSFLTDLMPTYGLREVDRVAVRSGPREAWAAARRLDFYRVPFARRLFALRTAPASIAARLRGQPAPAPERMLIDDIVAPGTRWLLLGEEPGHEVAVGSAGRFWRSRIEFAPLHAAGFRSFDEAGFGKVAWSLRVDPRADGGSWITLELRVGATDVRSWRRFRRYWALIGPFSQALRRGALRLLERELGPVGNEEAAALPGDTLLPGARLQRTHSRFIEAPPSSVWPWLVQMGCQRAGWYSYDRLDNGGVPSASHIVPELEHVAVGDIIPFRPTGRDGFAVLQVERPHALVIGSPLLLPGGGPAPEKAPPPWRTSWAFVLEPVGARATRLLVRARADYRPGLTTAVVRAVMIALHEVMERAQLRHLKHRIETLAPS
jgi:hypothetical protein